MRPLKIIFGAFVAVMTASAAAAEQWIDIGTNSAFRPELQSGLTFCIDKDSVKTDDLGWTSYVFKLCNEPREIFEASVQCAQNLSVDQVPIRQRTLVANGKSTPDQPWKTNLTYMSSISGRLAKFACGPRDKPKAANETAPKWTMAAEVLARLEKTKDYGELSALHNKKLAADSNWLQSAEGRAMDAQLKNWRSDAAATAIVDDKEGRILRYSVGGVIVRDTGVAAADLEKSPAYRHTIAEAIAQNIVTSPLDPKVQAALASFRDESETKTCYTQTGDVAIAACTRAINSGRLKGRDLAGTFLYRGTAYKGNHDFDRAIADFSEAIRLDSESPFAYGQRGLVYSQKSDYDRAIADLTRFIALNPGRQYMADAYIARATAYAAIVRVTDYAEKDRFDPEIADLTKAIALRPDYALLFKTRGSAYELKRQRDMAIADYRAVLRIDPADQDAKDALKRLDAAP